MSVLEFVNEYSIVLDEEQKRLLELQNHPVLVNGSVGSGKSFLFLNRIAYLLKSELVNKSEMLNIVFDKAVVKQMETKYRYHFGDDGSAPSFTDIYSFAYRLIRRQCELEGRICKKAYRDLSSVIIRLVKDMFGMNISKDQGYDILSKISECKNLMMSEKQMADIEIHSCKNIKFLPLYQEFKKFKEKKGIYDYDDILSIAVEVLMKNHDLLEDVQKTCRFVQVDDAQELSFLGHMLIKIITAQTSEIMMFADMDVSIASKRAAYPRALDAFKDTYPGAEIIVRNMNYRSNATIVDVCNKFYYKEEPKLTHVLEDTCELKFKGFAELSKLYAYAARKIEECEGSIGFLYRNFSMAVPLVEMLKEQGVSFCFDGNMKNFIQNQFVCDMWNFIELLIDSRDMRAFYEVYETMGLDISKRVLLEVAERLRADESVDVYQALMESNYKQAGKKKLASLMERIRMAENKSTSDMILFIREKMGYNDYLLKTTGSMQSPAIYAFETLAQRYDNPDEFLYKLSSLKEFQGDLSSRVHILSLDNVKGTEFDLVCFLDCVRQVMPKVDKNEERVLFYNGMARAKHELEFLSAKRSVSHRLEISPYLYEIHDSVTQTTDEESKTGASRTSKKIRLTNLKRGVKIVHKQWGVGKIMKIDDGMMHVQFDEGLKQMNMRLCITKKLVELY